MQSTTTITCKRCLINKPLTAFKDYTRNGKTKKTRSCLDCISKRMEQTYERYRLEHTSGIRERDRIFRCKNPNAKVLTPEQRAVKKEREKQRRLVYAVRYGETYKRGRSRWAESLHGRFANTKRNAEKRGIPWLLSYEEFCSVTNTPCVYCGDTSVNRGGRLDRIDNSGTYEITNVVPACWACNKTRNDTWTHEEFLRFIPVIRYNLALRRLCGPPQATCGGETL